MKRYLSILLVALMVLAFLVSCSVLQNSSANFSNDSAAQDGSKPSDTSSDNSEENSSQPPDVQTPDSNSTIESEHSMLNEFCIDDYQEEIQIFHCDKTTEPVKNEFDAEKIAEEIWLDYFGQEILQEKPFVVFYDKANHAWLVQSTLPEDLLGGSAYIIINGISGEILAVWREK